MCVESCPPKWFVYVEDKLKYCVEKCPLTGDTRYFRTEKDVKICMDGCQKQNEASSVYVVASYSDDGCECKTKCSETEYVLPNGTCV